MLFPKRRIEFVIMAILAGLVTAIVMLALFYNAMEAALAIKINAQKLF